MQEKATSDFSKKIRERMDAFAKSGKLRSKEEVEAIDREMEALISGRPPNKKDRKARQWLDEYGEKPIKANDNGIKLHLVKAPQRAAGWELHQFNEAGQKVGSPVGVDYKGFVKHLIVDKKLDPNSFELLEEEQKTGPPVISKEFEKRVHQGLATGKENSIEPYFSIKATFGKKAIEFYVKKDVPLIAEEQAEPDEKTTKGAPRKTKIHNLNNDPAALHVGKKANASQEEEPADEKPAPTVPDRVAKSYVELDGKYYFVKKPDQLAFVDKGVRLQTKLTNAKVAASMVDVAEARNWTELQVKGTSDFRREAWLEATSRGLKVRGYKPKAEDLARLKKMSGDRQSNEVEAREPADTPRNAQGAGQDLDTKPDPANPLAGKLIDHGKAPYKNDRGNRASYYVKLENADGKENTTWGVDLERAVSESGVKAGDRVELESKGRQPVTINRPVRDDQGKVVGTEKVNTHRNQWELKAEVLRDKDRDAREVVRDHPDLVNEIAAIKVAEKFSQEKFANAADRERFMKKVRGRISHDVSQGNQAPKVKLVEEKVIAPKKEKELESER